MSSEDKLIESLEERLSEIDRVLPDAPWRLWTSNSYRRIGGPRGGDGDVLSATTQRGDNHLDLTMPEHQLEALVALRNTAAEAASELSRRASRIEELEKALRLIVEIGVEAKRHEPMDDFDRGSRAARGETHDIARRALDHPDKEGGK